MTDTNDWATKAACLGTDPSLFFPDNDEDHARAHAYDPARRVCADCPVRIDCLSYALATNTRHGFWGGYNMNSVKMRARAHIELAEHRAGAAVAA